MGESSDKIRSVLRHQFLRLVLTRYESGITFETWFRHLDATLTGGVALLACSLLLHQLGDSRQILSQIRCHMLCEV